MALAAGCGREPVQPGLASAPSVPAAAGQARGRSDLLAAGGSADAEERAQAAPPAEPEPASAEASETLQIDVRTESGRVAQGLGWNFEGRSPRAPGQALVVDSQGRLEVPAEWFTDSGLRGEHGDEPLILSASLLGAPAPQITLPDRIPPTPLEIRVPNFGSIAVELIDALGDGVDVEQSVTAAVHDTARGVGGASLPPKSSAQIRGSKTSGLVVFPAVALGHRLWIHSEATLGTPEPAMDVLGPVADGERVEIQIEGRGTLPELIVRLVDEAGEFQAGVQVQAMVRALPRGFESNLILSADHGTSDETGTVRFTPERSMRGLELHWLELQEQRDERRGAAVRLPASLEGLEQFDLGTVVLGSHESLVGGVLMNGFGVPYSDADLELLRLRSPLEPGPVLWKEYASRVDPPATTGVLQLGSWIPSTAALGNGRFELSGYRFLEGEHYALRVSPESGAEFLHAVEIGDLEVDVQGPAGSGLALEVFVDWDALPLGSLWLLIRSSGRSVGQHELSARAPGLRLAMEPAADVTVEVFVGTLKVHESEKISILEGQLTDLGLLDLTGRVSSFEIEVRSSVGERLVRASVWHGVLGGEVHYLGGGLNDLGRQLILRPPGPGEWFVEAPGYRTARLETLVADQVVVLNDGLVIELVLAAGEPGVGQREARLVPHQRLPGRAGQAQRVRFDAEGRSELRLPAPGTWTLEWHAPGANPDREEPLATEVLEVTSAGGTFDVNPPPG